jgi:predicted RNA-binding Zn-ribbon protein involved in translation (DUF1610 family)
VREYMPKLYEIDKDRYRELLYICRQYRKDRERLANIRAGAEWKAGERVRGSGISDTTAQRAARAADSWYLRRTHAIEQAAIAADATLCEYILRHATEGARYEDMCPPCGRAQFYRARRAFYWELDQRL